MSKKSAAVGTGAMALSPLVDMLESNFWVDENAEGSGRPQSNSSEISRLSESVL